MKTVDIVILILTASISVFLLVSIFSPLATGNTFSNEKAEMISRIITSVIAIISVYVGTKIKDNTK